MIRLRARALLFASGILTLDPAVVMSQRATLDTPRSVAEAAFAAYAGKRWGDFAMLVHVDALGEFRKQQLLMVDAWEHMPGVAEARDTTMPAAVAEYFDKMHAETVARFGNPVLRQFARVKTVNELKELSPQEFLARYLEATSPKPNPKDPKYQPPVTARHVIGEVPESGDLVHIVYRVHTDVGRYGRTESVQVLPVKRATDAWRVMLNSDLSFTGSVRMIETDSTR